MIWIPPKKASIDAALRKTFQQHGTVTMQMFLSTTNYFHHRDKDGNDKKLIADDVRSDLLAWLGEQYERAEVKETWSLTMEAAITVFVAIEVVPLVAPFIIKFIHWWFFKWVCL